MNEIIKNLSFEEYQKIDAVNFSTLKNIARSPAYYRFIKDVVKSTRSMDIGRAVHMMLLEPSVFDNSVSVYHGTRRGSAWECFKDENKGKEILRPSELETAKRMVESVLFHPFAGHIFLDHDSSTETTLLWHDPNTGLKCKARLDLIQDGRIVDLKTTSDPSPWEFTRSAVRYRYFTQFAFYLHGYYIITGERPEMMCVAVGNNGAHETVVYNVSNEAINHGNVEFTAMLEKLVECSESGQFPPVGGYKTQNLTVPEWCKPYGEVDFDPFEGI